MDTINVVQDIKNLINLPLQNFLNNESILTINEIDIQKKKIAIAIEGRQRLSVRSFKEIESVCEQLVRMGYCCIRDIVNANDKIINQLNTIFINLPYINYFVLDNAMYLVLRDTANRPFGSIEELSLKEQRQVKKTILNFHNFNFKKFNYEIKNNIVELNNAIDKIHLLAPGLLSETSVQDILNNFERSSKNLSSAILSLDVPTDFMSIDDEDSSEIKIDNDVNFDMSDIVDMSSFTGIDEGNTPSYLENDDEDLTTESLQLKIPNIRRTTPSFSLLYDRLLYNEIEIQPDYQRKDRIWSDDKKSKLIESILMGLPLPIFYFGERNNDNWVVIDGLQRLTTVQDFMQNKFSLKLESGSSVIDANGLYFKEFNRAYTRLIREFEITAYVIELTDASSNKFITELFHRINTYGVKLSDQEIRSAINFGSSVYYLKFLASTALFKAATTETVNTLRQKDLELCLGALSFIIYGYSTYRKNRYDDFLTETMQWINAQNFKKNTVGNHTTYISESTIITDITRGFENSLKFCQEIFGRDAFKKIRNSTKKDPISKPLFEMFVSLFYNLSESEKIKIRENKDAFLMIFYEAIITDSDNYAVWSSQSYIEAGRGFQYSISSSTGKRVTIRYRFEAVIKMIEISTGCKIVMSPISREKNDF